MDARELLLEAALKVFAEHGTRGATTRRIAQAAGVNEVTLFRQFGSKDGLLREALATSPRALAFVDTHLPDVPVDPHAELMEFCRHHHRTLFESRSIIRKCMGEFEENPETTRRACQLPVRISDALRGYLERLRDSGQARGDWNPRAAAAMLMGVLFTDAMGRVCMPERFPYSEREGMKHYVALFLQAIGAGQPARRAAAPASPGRRPARPARAKTTASRR